MNEQYEKLALLCAGHRKLGLHEFLKAARALDKGSSLLEVIYSQISTSSQQGEKNVRDAQVEWEKQRRLGLTILHPLHPSYPVSFFRLQDPPIFLSLKGQMPRSDQFVMSVVGPREPTAMAVSWLETHLLQAMREAAFWTVSGGARGIDQKTHFLSCWSSRPTLTILPSGIENPYPPNIGGFLDRIISEGGGVLSEYWSAQPMRSYHFLHRNRLIAGLADFILVAEAARKSGSFMTGRLAMENGIFTGVLPNSPMEVKSLGGLDLLRDGAQLVLDAKDLHGYLNDGWKSRQHLVGNIEITSKPYAERKTLRC